MKKNQTKIQTTTIMIEINIKSSQEYYIYIRARNCKVKNLKNIQNEEKNR